MWSAALIAKLREARIGVAAALGVAVLAGMLVSFHVVIGLPPSIESRRYTVGVAGISLQLDTALSQIVDGSGATGNIRTLSDRASLLSALLASTPVKQDIARSLNVAPQRLVVTTATTFAERTRALKAGVTTSAQPGRDAVLIDVKDPRLDEGFSPIIQVQTEAPDAKLAIAAAEASVKALGDYVQAEADRDGLPPARRVVFRRLEPARHAEETRGRGPLVGLFAALAVFAGGCAFVLYARGIMVEMRSQPRLTLASSGPKPVTRRRDAAAERRTQR